MTLLKQTLRRLETAADSVTTAIESSERVKKELNLLKHVELRRMGLGAGDIRQIPQVWRDGCTTPRYQALDVQMYIDSVKRSNNKQKR